MRPVVTQRCILGSVCIGSRLKNGVHAVSDATELRYLNSQDMRLEVRCKCSGRISVSVSMAQPQATQATVRLQYFSPYAFKSGGSCTEAVTSSLAGGRSPQFSSLYSLPEKTYDAARKETQKNTHGPTITFLIA